MICFNIEDCFTIKFEKLRIFICVNIRKYFHLRLLKLLRLNEIIFTLARLVDVFVIQRAPVVRIAVIVVRW